MSAPAYGQRAKALLLELKRSAFLPAYSVRVDSGGSSVETRRLTPVCLSLVACRLSHGAGGVSARYFGGNESLVCSHSGGVNVCLSVCVFCVVARPSHVHLYPRSSPHYDPSDMAVNTGLLVQQRSTMRNKRCLLAYLCVPAAPSSSLPLPCVERRPHVSMQQPPGRKNRTRPP